MEDENMTYACTKYTDTTFIKNYVPSVPETCDRQLKKFLTNFEQYPLFNKHPLTNGNKKSFGVTWQSEYYRDLFGGYDSSSVKKYCLAYIEGLIWILNYYYNRRYDNFWCYPYTLCPLTSDLYKCIMNCQKNEIIKTEKKLRSNTHSFTITPLLQLLCVIPPQSISIFPEHVTSLITDPSHNLMQCFPSKFRLCTFMKHYLWECTPILPDIDIVHAFNTLQYFTHAKPLENTRTRTH
jgi:5'-3' exonuclease